MNNDSLIIKKTFILFTIGFIINLVVAILTHLSGLPLGWSLGYALSLLVFKINTAFVDAIVYKRMGKGIFFANYACVLCIYTCGLIMGFVFTAVCHYASVFLGYLIPKMTIYWMAITERRKTNELDSE